MASPDGRWIAVVNAGNQTRRIDVLPSNPSLKAKCAAAELRGFQVTGVKEGDGLKVRYRPDWKSEELGELEPKSECIRSLGRKAKPNRDQWWLVEAPGGTRGWVNSRFLAPMQDSSKCTHP